MGAVASSGGAAKRDARRHGQFFKRADARLISAETNTLYALPLEANDRLMWLHSDTPEGLWCAERLHEHYRAQGHASELVPIRGMAYVDVDFAEAGLKTFANIVLDLIRKWGAPQVKLCATGGFKAEIAFANLIGFLMGVPVYYIHEQFRQIVERHEDFFIWIDQEPRPSAEVLQRLHGRNEVRPFLLFDDEHTMLSALGDLLLNAFKTQTPPAARWPPSSALQPTQKIKLQGNDHHRPRNWRKCAEWLASFDCVQLISYEPNATGGTPKTRFNGFDDQTLEASFTFSDGDLTLGLRVKTTARDSAELQTFLNCASSEIRHLW